jgi:hypothetical protein
LRGGRRQNPSFLSKLSKIFACFLQIFAKISLAVLIVFNELAQEKSFFAPWGGFQIFVSPFRRRPPGNLNLRAK